MSNPTQNPFVKAALANIDKSKSELATEKVEEFLAEARTEITVQLAQAKAEVIRSKAALTKTENGLKKAKAKFEVARYAVPTSGTLTAYIDNRNFAKQDIESSEVNVNSAKNSVEDNEAIFEAFKTVEKDLA